MHDSITEDNKFKFKLNAVNLQRVILSHVVYDAENFHVVRKTDLVCTKSPNVYYRP